MTRLAFLGCVVLSVLGAAVGCGNGAPKCVAGASTACTGPAGCAGGQVCNADGTYAACICGTADASTPDASTPDASTPDAGMTDSGGGMTDGSTDAGTDAGPPPCDPVAQTGCMAGQRCTWVNTGGSPAPGHVACLADGTVAALGACTVGADGETTGFDDCRAGLYCGGGLCGPICDTSAPNPTGYACMRFAGLFVDAAGTVTTIGVGAPTCNPLTQVREADGAAACGSPDPSTPTRGCYGSPGSEFSCASAGAATLTSDVAAAGPGGGGAFLNGCAPGFVPLLHRSSADMTVICVALCQPGPTSAGLAGNAQGVTPHTCPDRGAGGTHECRYWWSFETAPYDRWGNTLGYCEDYTQYTFGSPATADPSCTTLSLTADTDGDGMPDATEWGCVPHS